MDTQIIDAFIERYNKDHPDEPIKHEKTHLATGQKYIPVYPSANCSVGVMSIFVHFSDHHKLIHLIAYISPDGLRGIWGVWEGGQVYYPFD